MKTLILILVTAIVLCTGLDNPANAQDASDNAGESQSTPAIEWEPLNDYFEISKVRMGREKHRDTLGRIDDFNTLSFIVEAKTRFSVAVFFAHFYDVDGIEVGSLSPVAFDPDYSGSGWEPGTRSRAAVLLPEADEMAKVSVISFDQL